MNRMWFAVSVVLLVAGCGGGGETPQRPGAPEVHAAWTACPAVRMGAQDALTLPLLDPGFPAVSAVICGGGPLVRPDGGQDMVFTESRADDIAALVAALLLPDQGRTDGVCTLDLVIPPWLALLDGQGRWVRPGVPVDPCGKPRAEVRSAVDKLTLEQVSSRPIKEIESAAAAAAGCSQQWADMISVEAPDISSPGEVGTLYDGPEPVRLCAYRVPPDQQGSGKPAGDFQYGRILSAEQWAQLKREVRTSAPAVACSTPAGQFAVVRTGGGEIYAELDGCRRVMPESGGRALRQASPALLALLARE